MIDAGKQKELHIGNLDAKRDWGHAKEYVEMQWKMLQQVKPKDYVIATGKQYSVRQFIIWAARELGIEVVFKGSGVDEVGVVNAVEGDLAPNVKVGQKIVQINPRYFRPAEVETLLGDASKAKNDLGWEPKISAQEMCLEMVKEDYQAARRTALLKEHNLEIPVSIEN